MPGSNIIDLAAIAAERAKQRGEKKPTFAYTVNVHRRENGTAMAEIVGITGSGDPDVLDTVISDLFECGMSIGAAVTEHRGGWDNTKEHLVGVVRVYSNRRVAVACMADALTLDQATWFRKMIRLGAKLITRQIAAMKKVSP